MHAWELIIRFLVGGALVSAFATLGDIFQPKSFAGLFSAAPSVALATIGLAILESGKPLAAVEARSMLAGAVALFFYSAAVSRTMMRHKTAALWTTLCFLPLWLGCAFGLWYVCLR